MWRTQPQRLHNVLESCFFILKAREVDGHPELKDFELGAILWEMDWTVNLAMELEDIQLEEKANAHQVGGNHYRKANPEFQHWDLMAANFETTEYWVAAITKYITRWRSKDGVKSVEKARHYLQKMIELLDSQQLPYPDDRLPHGMGRFLEEHGISGVEERCLNLAMRFTTRIELSQLQSNLNELLRLAEEEAKSEAKK